jgi:hypothetical protein
MTGVLLLLVISAASLLWLGAALGGIWARSALQCHVAFGVFMVATAAFSHRPWITGVQI